MDLKIVNQLDKDQWRAFVDAHPDSNIFHTPEMFDVFNFTKGYKPSLWAVLDDQNQIQALFIPVKINLLGGVAAFLTTRTVNFGSILAGEGEPGEAAVSFLLKEYNSKIAFASLFTEIRHISDRSVYQNVFLQNGYQYESYLNYFINLLCDQEDFIRIFNRSTRKAINSNLRNRDVVIKEITEPSMLVAFYELIRKTYTLAKVPLADSSLFEAAYQILMPKKMVRFAIAYIGNTEAAAVVSLLYKDVMYGWYMGVDRKFRAYNPTEICIWDELRWGCENGYKIFDFGGAGKPDEDFGVRDFKLKFKGSLVEHGRNTCIHAPFRMKLA